MAEEDTPAQVYDNQMQAPIVVNNEAIVEDNYSDDEDHENDKPENDYEEDFEDKNEERIVDMIDMAAEEDVRKSASIGASMQNINVMEALPQQQTEDDLRSATLAANQAHNLQPFAAEDGPLSQSVGANTAANSSNLKPAVVAVSDENNSSHENTT